MSNVHMLPAEALSQQTFRALLAALSFPGRPQRLPAAGNAAFAQIGTALLDLETTWYCPDVGLAAMLAFSGARQVPQSLARYQFYPALHEADLAGIAQAPAGSYSYPDESATLVLGCEIGAGRLFELRGPGIKGRLDILVGGVPDGLWDLRARSRRYPLGWDLFLVDADTVIGVPRSTIVEVC